MKENSLKKYQVKNYQGLQMKVCETSYILEVPQRSKAAVIKTYRNTNYSRDIYVFMIAKIG